MGIFDRFKKKDYGGDSNCVRCGQEKNPDDGHLVCEECRGLENPVDSLQMDFESICSSINEYFTPEPIADEKELQGQLAVFFRTKYPNREVEREVSIGRGSRIDILIDQRFAFELKVPRNRIDLRNLVSQLDEYSETFPKICAVLMILDPSLLEIAEEYSSKYKQQCNAETVIIGQGTKRNSRNSSRMKPSEDVPPRRRNHSRRKEETKADKVAKGIKGAMKVIDALSPEPPKPERTRKKSTKKSKSRKTRKKDPFGLDKVADSMKFDSDRFFGSQSKQKDDDDPFGVEKFFGSSKRSRRKNDDDPFGVGSFDDFFGGSSKKKRRRKSDDDWSFGL